MALTCPPRLKHHREPPYDRIRAGLSARFSLAVSIPSGLESKVVDLEGERPALVAEAVAQRVEPRDRALVQMHTMRSSRRTSVADRSAALGAQSGACVAPTWRPAGRVVCAWSDAQ
jgi:hypothetical protein